MSKQYHAGYDYFTPDAGQHKDMRCNACGENMQVQRKVKQRQHGRFDSRSNNK